MSGEELKSEIIKRLNDISDDNLTKVLKTVFDLQEKHKNMTDREKNLQFILIHDEKLLKLFANS